MSKDRNRKINKFQKELQDADKDKVGQYLQIFDRVLLYSLAANMMPAEGIHQIIESWEKIAKQTIDIDASSRTSFLESNKFGRIAKYREEPDGEEVRLHCLKQLDLAKKVVSSNLEGIDGFDSKEQT